MLNPRSMTLSFALALAAALPAHANSTMHEYIALDRTDYVNAGIGGISAPASLGGGAGTLTLEGVSGTVTLVMYAPIAADCSGCSGCCAWATMDRPRTMRPTVATRVIAPPPRS